MTIRVAISLHSLSWDVFEPIHRCNDVQRFHQAVEDISIIRARLRRAHLDEMVPGGHQHHA